MHRTLSLCTRTATRPLQRHTLTVLRPPINMEIIPHLGDLCTAIVQRPFARGRLVVPGPGAADERRGAVLGLESFLESGQGVSRGVGGGDVVGRKPLKGVEAAVVQDHGLEEVDDFGMADVLGAVARDVERGEAGGVFGELVLCGIWLALLTFGLSGSGGGVCNLRPRGLGLESSARSRMCSCTRGDRICRTARGTCQCPSRCRLERRCH